LPAVSPFARNCGSPADTAAFTNGTLTREGLDCRSRYIVPAEVAVEIVVVAATLLLVLVTWLLYRLAVKLEPRK
jgi:hypothetical protein